MTHETDMLLLQSGKSSGMSLSLDVSVRKWKILGIKSPSLCFSRHASVVCTPYIYPSSEDYEQPEPFAECSSPAWRRQSDGLVNGIKDIAACHLYRCP
jgi:hypothetical protein